MKNLVLATFMLISVIGNIAIAATYYVKPNGDNDADGRSHATAWKTIAKVNSEVSGESSGHDVYFLEGGEWSNQQLTVDWGGTSSNRAVVGAYHLNGGKETVGVSAGGKLPTIKGPYLDAKNDPVNQTGAIPFGWWDGLVNVNGNFTTLENIRITNSSGRGTFIRGDNNIVQNVDYYYIAASCLQIQGPGGTNASGNVFRSSTCYWADLSTKEAYNSEGHPSASHPPCIVVSPGNHHNLIEDVEVETCGGEGIGVNGANFVILRNNRIGYSNRSGIYLDATNDIVVEQNILHAGDPKPKGWFQIGTPGYPRGIVSSVESRVVVQSENNIIRNNVVIHRGECIGVGIWNQAIEAGNTNVIDFYGNTCIENNKAVDANKTQAIIKAKNNIFKDTVQSVACTAGNDDTFDYNLWTAQPSDIHCRGNNDPTAADPKLNKSGGWAAVSRTNLPTDMDLTPQSGSRTSQAGLHLASTTWLAPTNYPQRTELLGSCPLDQYVLAQDRRCNTRLNPADIGGYEINVESPVTSVALPFYMNIGGGELNLSKTYLAEDYLVSSGAYSKTTTMTIEGTADDAVYQSWRGINGSMTWSIPIANGHYDLTLLYQESYWGVTEGTCTMAGSNRQIDVSVEGVLERDEFDICKLAGAPLTAARDVIPNITVTDGQLNIELSLGLGADPKPQLMGLEITLATPVPSPPSNLIVR